jgi:hypothetical protein
MPNRHGIPHARSRKRGIVSKPHFDKETYRDLARFSFLDCGQVFTSGVIDY